MKELKEALEGFKKEVLDKIKEQKDSSVDDIAKAEKKIEEKIKEYVDEQLKSGRKLSVPGLEDEKQKFQLHKVVRFLTTQKWEKDAGFEKEICEQLERDNDGSNERKSANAGTRATGGALIPDEVTNEIIDLAIAQMPISELGIDKMGGLRGELPIPKLTARNTAYWVGEEEAPTESNNTWGEITLRPKTLGAFTKISKRLIWQSSGVAEKEVRKQLVNSMSLKLEEALISGSGTDKQPKGIVNYSNLTSTSAIGTNGGRFRVDKATDMVTAIDVANMLKPNGKFGFLMRPEVKQGLATERVVQYSGQSEANGMPVINPFMSQAELETMLGYKCRTTTLISNTLTKGTSTTCSYVIFGDWAQVILGSWMGMELTASATAGNSGGSAMLNRQIWLTAFQDVDIQVRNETGLTVLSDAEATKANW